MNSQALIQDLQRALPLLYKCEEENPNRLRVFTPFLYPDGDYIELYIEDTPAGLYLTDLGEILGYLGDHSISLRSSPKRQKMLQDILQTHGVEQFKGELRIRLDTAPRDIAWVVHRLGQAAIQATDLIYTLRLSSLATFREEVEEFWIETHTPYEKNRRVIGGSGEIHTIDFYLPGPDPTLVATLSSSVASYANDLTSKVVRAWHDIHRIDGRFAYLSVIDDSSDVWRPEWIDQMRQLSDVVFWKERDRILDLLPS